MNKLKKLLKENFGDLCYLGENETIIYYKEGIDLKELSKVIKGYNVGIQLNLL
jgi:hypothetical protein